MHPKVHKGSTTLMLAPENKAVWRTLFGGNRTFQEHLHKPLILEFTMIVCQLSLELCQ